jgi:hypothetical protein
MTTMLANKAIVHILIGKALPIFTRSEFTKQFKDQILAGKLLTELFTEGYITRIPDKEVRRLKWKALSGYFVAEPKLVLVHMILATKQPWPVVKQWFQLYTTAELYNYLKLKEEGPNPII